MGPCPRIRRRDGGVGQPGRHASGHGRRLGRVVEHRTLEARTPRPVLNRTCAPALAALRRGRCEALSGMRVSSGWGRSPGRGRFRGQRLSLGREASTGEKSVERLLDVLGEVGHVILVGGLQLALRGLVSGGPGRLPWCWLSPASYSVSSQWRVLVTPRNSDSRSVD